MNEIFNKLDLNDYLQKLFSLMSRKNSVFLQGDSKINYEKILEFAKFDIKICEKVANLDDALMRLSKQGVLHISEIFEFSKIINYFLYLKSCEFSGILATSLIKIEIPDEIIKISKSFDKNGEFKDEIDERLIKYKNAYKIKKDEISSFLKKIIYSKNLTSYLVDTQIHFINDVETLLLRGGFNHALKGSVIARSSSGYFYVLPESIAKLKGEQAEILDKISQINYEICKNFSLILSKNLLFLKFINNNFDQFDGLISRAILMRNNDFELVLSDNSKDIKISNFAHPALKNPKSVSVDFKGQVLLITGVNAGGKSMLLKSIMSAVLMSKYLLPMKISSSNSKIGNFKEFDAIIEDPQNVKNDISTFAGRMLHFSKLFGHKNLLLGVDEIELGTDFEEAASLYSVLINQLKKDAKIIITTHHKRLAMLLSKNDDVELIAALYDEKASLPKYEFLKGTIGKSYAFETAVRYGIPANLVAIAKKEYGEDKENLNIAISKAINLESELKQKLADLKIKQENLDNLFQKAKDEKDKFDENVKNTISKLEFDFYKAINEAKRGINLKNTKEKQQSLNLANDLHKNIKKPEISNEKIDFKVGDFVKYGSIKGEIVAINKNEATIESQGLKLRVGLKLLKRSTNLSKISPKTSINVEKPKQANVILDLHGLRSEEAIEKLDKFISDSLILGFDEVIIKHGIGTGKLAFAVKNFLKNHKSVKEIRDGTPSEGGFGSKIVKF